MTQIERHGLLDIKYLGVEVGSWSGPFEAQCRCPWHRGSRCNMSVNIKKGMFICYGCGEKGAVERIAAHADVQGKCVWTNKQVHTTYSFKDNDDSWQRLLYGDLAYDNDYLDSRNVTWQQIEKFGIRKLKNGIAIPLPDLHGRAIGVLVRFYEGFVRYKQYGEKPPMWPLNQFVDHGQEIFLTEGVFGVLAADRAGVPAMATLSASVNWSAKKYIERMKPVVVFDHDLAGYQGALKVMKMNPITRVVIPGCEADELDVEDWRYIQKGEIAMTRSTLKIKQLATRFEKK